MLSASSASLACVGLLCEKGADSCRGGFGADFSDEGQQEAKFVQKNGKKAIDDVE